MKTPQRTEGCKFTSASNQSCNNNCAFISNHSSRFPNQTNIISQFQTSVLFRSLKLLQTYTKELKLNLQTVLNEVQSQELGLTTLVSPSQLSTFYDFTIWDFGPFEVYGKLPSHWLELSFSDVINLSWMGNRLKIYFLDDLIWVRKATVILCYPWCSIHSSVFLMLHEFSVQAGLWSFIGEFLIWASQKKTLRKQLSEDWWLFPVCRP